MSALALHLNDLSPALAGLKIGPCAFHVLHDGGENMRRDRVAGRVRNRPVGRSVEQVRSKELRAAVPSVLRPLGYVLRQMFDCVYPPISPNETSNTFWMQPRLGYILGIIIGAAK